MANFHNKLPDSIIRAASIASIGSQKIDSILQAQQARDARLNGFANPPYLSCGAQQALDYWNSIHVIKDSFGGIDKLSEITQQQQAMMQQFRITVDDLGFRSLSDLAHFQMELNMAQGAVASMASFQPDAFSMLLQESAKIDMAAAMAVPPEYFELSRLVSEYACFAIPNIWLGAADESAISRWKKRQEKCAVLLLEASWSPTIVLQIPIIDIKKLCNVLTLEGDSFSVTERVNQFIFRQFGKEYINSLPENWRIYVEQPHIFRLLTEAVGAYKRREHGIVVTVLSVIWEEFIYNYAEVFGLKGKKPPEIMQNLVLERKLPQQVSTFYKTCIAYSFHRQKLDEVKPDVPGRNAVAHGCFPQYPTRKAALNAILFTDFLITLNTAAGEAV